MKMEKIDSKINIDIAGGEGEYFYAKARRNPQETFIVLDPVEGPATPSLKNLHRIAWKSDIDSHLPFRSESVDQVCINFLTNVAQSPTYLPLSVF